MARFTVQCLIAAFLTSTSNANNLKILSPEFFSTDQHQQETFLHADPVFHTVGAGDIQGDVIVGHYGPPPDACEADEQMFQIQGVPGKICSPKCDDMGGCPKDIPDGVTATPQCALSNSATGDKYCVLICHEADDDTKSESHFLRSVAATSGAVVGDAQCGDADCHIVQQGLGICTYGG